MNNPVIVRVVKYIPRGGGNVVYEAFEEVEVSPGKWLPLDPRNPTPEEVESADDKAIAQQQATIATLTAERDSLQSQLAAMTTERDTALSEKASLQTSLDSANATIETLQATNAELQTSVSTLTGERDTAVSELATANARIAELTAIAEQPICTNFQIRAWLITKFGLGIIDQVTAMIASIPDATQRLLANQQWEYANNVLRDNPFVEQIAAALGMKSDEMDAAYLEASKIV